MAITRSKDILQLLPIFTWLTETTDGDLAELHSSIEKKFGRRLGSDYASCLGEKCPDSKRCLLQQIRRQAKQADLLITNHSLAFIDLAEDAAILPAYTRIIFDEAMPWKKPSPKLFLSPSDLVRL
jgi:ATP-dependent DNA helicase DinG